MAILDHYLNLVTSEHRDKKKFMATVEALLRHSDDIFEAGIYVDDEFDLDEAVGAQEDVLGEIVGTERTLPYVPHTSATQVMDNESYRIMLKSKIAKNAWKGGIEDLEEIWNILFDTRIPIQDNQDMTVTVTLDPYDSLLQEHIVHGLIIPKPQSVRVNCLANFSTKAEHHVGMIKSTIKTVDVYPAAVEQIQPESDFYVALTMTTTEEIILQIGGI